MALIDNLISYWKLDGNSNDATDTNNDGTDTAVVYGVENLTGYTESDADGVLSQTTTRATFTNADYHASTYLYKDYGVAHFNATFRQNLDFRFTSASATPANFNLWGLSNYLGSQNELDVANRPLWGIQMYDWDNANQHFALALFEQKPGGSGFYFDGTSISLDLNTTYYLQVYYNSAVGTYGTLYLYIYPTDADRTAGTNAVDTLTVTLHEVPSFRYLYTFQIYVNNGVTTNDVSGYVENLSILPLSNYGRINQGAGFNGATSKIRLGTAIAMPTDLTVSAWIKTSAAANGVVFADNNVAATTGWWLQKLAAGKLSFFWCTAADAYRGYETDSAVIANDGTWHLVTITQVGTNAPTFYVNGSSTAASLSDTAGASTKPTAQGAAIGELGPTDYAFFNGAIDEIGIWSRALSSTEVGQLYNSGSGLAYPLVLPGPASVKTINGLAIASVKTVNGLAIASVKSVNGLT